jgi:LysR family transcriptional regulator, repressor for citA
MLGVSYLGPSCMPLSVCFSAGRVDLLCGRRIRTGNQMHSTPGMTKEESALDLRLLRTFQVTARTLNFRRAAEHLFMAQPTVTQHIRQLEEELRVQLFDRTSRRVKLTAGGERWLFYANQVLAVFDKGIQDLSGWQQGYRDRLVVAVSPVIARSTLPRVVQRFTNEHPNVEVVIQVVISQDIPSMVADGRAHIGLARIDSGSRDLQSRVWYTDPVMLVVRGDGGDHDSPPPDWREVLSKERLLTQNHPGYWDDLLLALYNLGMNARTMEVSLVDITKRFIEEGLGVSFLPESSVRRELLEGRLLEVPTPGLTLPVTATYVITPSQGLTEVAEQFSQLLSRAK